MTWLPQDPSDVGLDPAGYTTPRIPTMTPQPPEPLHPSV